MTCYSAFDKNGAGRESYCQHINLALEEWRRLKPYYWDWVSRMFDGVDAVEIAILFHDLGKLGKAYIDAYTDRKLSPHLRRASRRHELISAYWAYRVLPAPLNYYIATAVALHHEPILLGVYAGALGERRIQVSTIYAMLKAIELGLGCKPECVDPRVKQALDLWERGEINAGLATDAFRDIVAFLSAGPSNEVRRKRALVGGLLHLLVIADSRAAMRGRQGKGTRLAQLSLQAEPA
jgi:CRISPR-associated endonuclease Cas3-HD